MEQIRRRRLMPVVVIDDAALAVPLAAAGVSIFALSTFDTDYVLVKEAALPAALEALRRAGHRVGEG